MTGSTIPDRATLIDRLTAAWTWTTARVADIDAGDLALPTPCDRFDVGALLDHTAQSVERFIAALGGTAPPPGTDESPADRFHRLRQANLAAWDAADLNASYELPLGRLPAPLVADINLSEIVLHGWDVSRATGEHADVPDQLADEVLQIGHALLTDHTRSPAFASAVPVPLDASPSDRMAAYYGRRP